MNNQIQINTQFLRLSPYEGAFLQSSRMQENYPISDVPKISSSIKLPNLFFRKRFADNLFLGKCKNEIINTWGIEENYYDLDEWAFFTSKNIFGGTTYVILNFNSSNEVSKLAFRTIYEF